MDKLNLFLILAKQLKIFNIYIMDFFKLMLNFKKK